MKKTFYKYQGTGNDFVIWDNQDGSLNSLTKEQIALICDRRMGVGADGLMLLNAHDQYDFEMKYFNADGGESSMCGNGGRCLVMFAHHLGWVQDRCLFLAVDGPHEATLEAEGIVRLKMKNVTGIQPKGSDSFLDTGSPHLVQFVPELDELDVNQVGRQIRYSADFKVEGVNVNFVQKMGTDHIKVRTYERGVEAETFSCGTGVTAAALVNAQSTPGTQRMEVDTLGGRLSVEFERTAEGQFQEIWLCGPALRVFHGTLDLVIS